MPNDSENVPAEQHEPYMRQCDPGIWDYRLYTFMQGTTLVGTMLVLHTSDPVSGRYQTGYEYWIMSNVPGAHATTTVSMADYHWRTAPPNKSTVNFSMVQAASWWARPPTLATPLLFNGVSGTGLQSIGIQWQLTLTGSTWGGSIIWSQSAPSGSNFNALFAGSTATQTFTDTTIVPTALTYSATVNTAAVP